MSYFLILPLSCKFVQLASLTVGSWSDDYLKPQIVRIVTNEYTTFNCSSYLHSTFQILFAKICVVCVICVLLIHPPFYATTRIVENILFLYFQKQ